MDAFTIMLTLTDSGGVVANSTSLALVSMATVFVGIWVWSQQKPSKQFPPGPKGWPVIGNILDFAGSKPPHIVCLDHAKTYGDIFSMKLGQQWAVIINGTHFIKQALLKKGVEFADRPSSFSIDLLSDNGKDILFGQYSSTWKLHRKIAHTAFRNIATGNNQRFEKLVYAVLPELSKRLSAKGSEPFEPKALLSSFVYNFLSSMCFGRQYEFDGPEIKSWMYLSQKGIEIVGNGLIADYIPIFKHIPTKGLRDMKQLVKDFFTLIDKEVAEHRTNYSGGDPKDLIEMLFHAQQEILEEGTEDIDSITETHIRQTVADIFGAGTDTTIFTMHWSVGLMVEHPDIQAKVAEEVDRVVGRDRLPCLDDRERLPYTVAALYEVIRFSSIVPLAIPHATSQDVEIGDYTIPKGVWVLFNIWSMHYDEKLWDEPKKFKPEHFLDESGKVRLHPEGYLPFSTGRRVCLGESVAKAELFLLFSWLFQHFRFSKPAGMEAKNFAEGKSMALSNILQDFNVVVEKRF